MITHEGPPSNNVLPNGKAYPRRQHTIIVDEAPHLQPPYCLYGGVFGRFAPCYTFVAFGIRASSSALTAPRCGGGAPGWSREEMQRRSHGKFPSGEGCRRSRRGGSPSRCSVGAKIPLWGGVSAEPTGWFPKQVQRRSHGKFPSGEGCRRSRRGGPPSVCRNVTIPVLTFGSRAPLLPRPPRGTCRRTPLPHHGLWPGSPHRLAAPPNCRPHPGYLPHLAARPPSRQAGDSTFETPPPVCQLLV